MHVQRELQICGLYKCSCGSPEGGPICCNSLQPPLQPPLQDKEVDQEDKPALAKDSKYAECDDILDVALANELGLD